MTQVIHLRFAVYKYFSPLRVYTLNARYLEQVVRDLQIESGKKLNYSNETSKQYYHSVEDYKADVFRLKTECKTIAKQSQTNLRKVFDDATRNDPCAADMSRQCIAQEGHFNLKFPSQLTSSVMC